jgi:hypothetical protein
MTDEPAFKPGDLVYLKSGSPKMTVVSATEDYVRVVFCVYGTDKITEQQIPAVALVLRT